MREDFGMVDRGRSFVTAVVALGLMAVACTGGSGTGTTAATPRVLVFGAEGELKGFNDGLSATSGLATRNVAQNTYFFAAKATPDFRLDFVGLERPPELVSTNVVEWVIKKHAVWSDGTQVTSEDLRYYWEQATDKGNDADVSPGYAQITKVEVTGEKSIRATFGSSLYADFPTLFGAVPQAAYMKANGGWKLALNESPGPSAGPYMFGSWEKGVSLTLVRNPKWWGPRKPALDSIVFRYFSSSASLIGALTNREIDMATPQADADLLKTARMLGYRDETGLSADFEQITYNTRSPFLGDPLVRRAVATAIDRGSISELAVKPISGTAPVLGNFVYMPNQPTYQKHDAAYERGDAAAARRLLEQAGWVPAGGGFTKGGETLKLLLATSSDLPVRRLQMDLIGQQLTKAGIGVTRDDCPLACLRERMTKTGPFDITGFGWTGGVAAATTAKAIYQTGSPRNYGKWSSPRFDELMSAAIAEVNPERQAALVNQADQILWDELPALPLYQKPNMVILSPRFVGPRPNGGGDGVFWNSQEWAGAPAK